MPTVTVITGGNAGIGAATASLPVAQDHCVVLGASEALTAFGQIDFASNARGLAGGGVPPVASPMRPQSASEVAEAIACVITHPVGEAYTNPASPELARRYYDQIGAFVPLS